MSLPKAKGELPAAQAALWGNPAMAQPAGSMYLPIQSQLQLPASLTSSCSLVNLAQNTSLHKPKPYPTSTWLQAKPARSDSQEKLQFWGVGLCTKPNSSTSSSSWLLPSLDAQFRNCCAMPGRRALAIPVPPGMQGQHPCYL